MPKYWLVCVILTKDFIKWELILPSHHQERILRHRTLKEFNQYTPSPPIMVK